MPSASQETIDECAEFLGTVNDSTACAYLKRRGYELSSRWTWSHPTKRTYDDMTRREFACLLYLCHEWDYGGLENV